MFERESQLSLIYEYFEPFQSDWKIAYYWQTLWQEGNPHFLYQIAPNVIVDLDELNASLRKKWTKRASQLELKS